MRFANPNMTLFLALFASMLPAAGPGTARSQPADSERAKIDAVAKRRAFYLPPDTEEVTDKREGPRALKPVWIRAGGTVTDPFVPGPFFVDAGGTYSSVGGRHVVIVKKGGKVSAFGGKSLVFYEKGADISGASIYPGTASATRRGILRGHDGAITKLAFSLDGRYCSCPTYAQRKAA